MATARVVLPGSESNLFLGDTDLVLAEITRFLREPEASDEDDDRQLGTVLFTDIVASTEQLAALGDHLWRKILDDHDRTIGQIVGSYRGRIVKTLGDGMLATFDGPARAVRCATALRDAIITQGITVRAGLHTGEIEHRGDDVAGMAVHTGARVAALAVWNPVRGSRRVPAEGPAGGVAAVRRGGLTPTRVVRPILVGSSPTVWGMVVGCSNV